MRSSEFLPFKKAIEAVPKGLAISKQGYLYLLSSASYEVAVITKMPCSLLEEGTWSIPNIREGFKLVKTTDIDVGTVDYDQADLAIADFNQPSKHFADITMPDFDKAVKATPCAGKDELRPAMMCVFFDEENLVATDAQVLSKQQHSVWFDAYRPFSIDAEDLKIVAKMLKAVEQSDIYGVAYQDIKGLADRDKYLVFEGQGIEVRCVNGYSLNKFPEYKRVIPQEHDRQGWVFEKEGLMRVLNVIAKKPNTARAVLTLSPSGMVFNFYTDTEYIEINVERYVCSFDSTPSYSYEYDMIVAIDCHYLLKLLAVSTAKTFELLYHSPSRAIKVDGGLLMPLYYESEYAEGLKEKILQGFVAREDLRTKVEKG